MPKQLPSLSWWLKVILLAMLAHTGMAFNLQIIGPDDPDLDLFIGRAKFSNLAKILSASSPVPHLIMADASSSSGSNVLTFRGSLPNCHIPVTIIGEKPDGSLETLSGFINVNRVDPQNLPLSVVVTGDGSKLNELVDDLKKNHDVKVVSNDPTKNEMAILLFPKGSDKPLPKAEAEKIIRDELKKKITGVVTKGDDCSKSCNDVCSTVVVHDASAGLLQTADVPSDGAVAYSGMPTKMEVRCGRGAFPDPREPCGPSTCSNGGTCNNDVSRGGHQVCNCKFEPSGPRCQLLTRSFQSESNNRQASTQHEHQLEITRHNSMIFKFQVAGVCLNDLCDIIKIEANSNEVLKVQQGRVTDTESMYNTATLPVSPTTPDKAALYSDRYVQTNRWLDVTVSLELENGQIKVKAVFCSKELTRVCFERTAVKAFSGDLNFPNVLLTIGGPFKGCFRNLKLNGHFVDLKPSQINGDTSLTQDDCPNQDSSCGGSGAQTCGSSSVCYGMLGKLQGGSHCSCNCIKSMRKTVERITQPNQCSAACSKDVPIISTAQANMGVTWQTSSDDFIPLDGLAPLVMKLRFRTRQQDVLQMMTVEMRVTSGPSTLTLKIESGILAACLGSICSDFMPRPVADGSWHTASARVAKSQMTLSLDGRDRVQIVDHVFATGAKVHLSLPSSCISDVRLSGVYLATSDADSTADANSVSVKFTGESGVSVDAACTNPQSTCTCNSATEDCDPASWGGSICHCKPGFKRLNAGATCEKPSGDPCARLAIKCPNGGTCKEAANGHWQVCV